MLQLSVNLFQRLTTSYKQGIKEGDVSMYVFKVEVSPVSQHLL